MRQKPGTKQSYGEKVVNRQIGLRRDPALHPVLYTGQFTAPGITLRFGRKRAGLTLEPNHVVDKLDRNAQPPRRLGMCAALLDKPHSAITQLNRMWLAHN